MVEENIENIDVVYDVVEEKIENIDMVYVLAEENVENMNEAIRNYCFCDAFPILHCGHHHDYYNYVHVLCFM